MAANSKIHEGMRTVSATSLTLAILMDDGHSVHVQGTEMRRVLSEIARNAPGLLHEALDQALEERIVSRLAEELSRE